MSRFGFTAQRVPLPRRLNRGEAAVTEAGSRCTAAIRGPSTEPKRNHYGELPRD